MNTTGIRWSRSALLLACLLALLAPRAQAVSFTASPAGQTADSATYQLTLNFADGLPSDLAEINAVRLSVVGSDPGVAGRLSLSPGLQWQVQAAFGSGPTPGIADLFWSLANPTTGLAPGQTSTLGMLQVDLRGWTGSSFVIDFGGGRDINTDQTIVIGADAGDPTGLTNKTVRPDLDPRTLQPRVPEPSVLAFLALGAAALCLRRR